MAAIQFSDTLRNALLDAYELTIGTSPKLRLYTGARPANTAAAASGTLICELTLPSDWQAAPSGGSSAKQGTWSGTTVAAGDVGYYRMYDSAGSTCHEQGDVSQAITLTTSALTAAGNNVLTFTATTGVTAGQNVAGTGVPVGATVLSSTSTTVTMSGASVGGVLSGAAISFGDTSGNLKLNNVTFTIGQGVVIDEKTMIAPGP